MLIKISKERKVVAFINCFKYLTNTTKMLSENKVRRHYKGENTQQKVCQYVNSNFKNI